MDGHVFTKNLKDTVSLDILSNAVDACNDRRNKSKHITNMLEEAGARAGFVSAHPVAASGARS